MFGMMLLSALTASASAADDRGPTLGLSGGLFWYDSDDNLGDTWTVVPRIGYQISRSVTVEGDLGFMQGLTDLDRSYNAFTPRVNLLFFPSVNWKVQPFVAAGPGAHYRNIPSFNFEDVQGGVSAADRNYKNPDLDFLINLGPGLRVPLGSRFSLRTDLRFAETVGGEPYSKEKAAEKVRDNFSDWEWTLGFYFHPGEVEADSDGDGLLDSEDRCVDDPEDADGFEDGDGCPDTDNDRDGILDTLDACPDEPEDADGFEDDDGCPDPDNDGDGVLDAEDACPVEPGVASAAGCPDGDGDGVSDAEDRCPDEYGEGSDGCPSAVVVDEEAGQIVILEKVYFDTDSATIQQRSYELLDEVAQVLKDNPQLERVEVAGHTDSAGDYGYNKQLSQRRAESVRSYLIDRGIDGGRLTAKGYGPDEPIADNGSEAGRSQNRRVEFKILE